MRPWDHFVNDFKHKRVLIFGLGLLGGGVGVTTTFYQAGSQVRVTDKKSSSILKPSLDKLQSYNLDFTLGDHRVADIDWAEIIIRNPSVPWDHPLLKRARSQNKPILMDVSLFLKYSQLQAIGITGTRGKTTTTKMIISILKQHQNRPIIAGGNLAHTSVISQLISLNPALNPLPVLELSSWQLQGLGALSLSPHLAVITNLYPDHLNVYSNQSAYHEDKKKIFKFQQPQDHLVLNSQQPEFKLWAASAPSQVYWFSDQDLPSDFSLKLLGSHNLVNAAAAFQVAKILGVAPDLALKTLSHFQPVPYRLEIIRIYHKRTFVNDTTSTTPTALIAALNSLPKPPVLIAGGESKNLPLTDLIRCLNQKTKALVLLTGSGTSALLPHLKPSLIQGVYSSLAQAVNQAINISGGGDWVLFSPGFTSFGLFNNEFDRGDQFNQIIQKL